MSTNMKKLPVVFMYSGQGSQYYQMGKPLYEGNSSFRSWMDSCDAVVKSKLGCSIVDTLYSENSISTPFDDVLLSSVALLCFEYSLTRTLIDLDIRPDLVLGYGLGEVSAAIASEAITFEEGIELVVCFAKALEATPPNAAMIAVMTPISNFEGLSADISDCWITAFNFDEHFVLTGDLEEVNLLKNKLDQQAIASHVLPVNYGLHTPLIENAKHRFIDGLKPLSRKEFSIPIVSSSKVQKVSHVDNSYFWELIRQPVYFEKTVGTMLEDGDYVFIDLCPSSTLSTFLEYLLPKNTNSKSLAIATQLGKDSVNLDTALSFMAARAQ